MRSEVMRRLQLVYMYICLSSLSLDLYTNRIERVQLFSTNIRGQRSGNTEEILLASTKQRNRCNSKKSLPFLAFKLFSHLPRCMFFSLSLALSLYVSLFLSLPPLYPPPPSSLSLPRPLTNVSRLPPPPFSSSWCS